MFRILSNGSHGNGVQIFLSKDLGIIRKVATTAASKAYLVNEFNGICWYQTQNSTNLSAPPKLWRSNSGQFLDISEELDTFKLSYLAPISKTMPYLSQVVDHYIDVWPNEPFSPVHGDLTLANILFRRQIPVIIDWEHFSSEELPWGFDLLYFVLASIFLPRYSRYRQVNFKPEDVIAYHNLVARFRPFQSTRDMLKAPFMFFQRTFRSTPEWLRIIDASPNKLFPNLIDQDVASRLDRMLEP